LYTHDNSISVTFTGQASLYAGDYGDYQIVVSKTTTNQYRVGIDVGASDTGSPLTVTGGEATTVSNAEVTHSSGMSPPTNLAHLVSNSASYHFRYTMPAAATAGSSHNLFGVAALGNTGTNASTTTNGWNYATTATIMTKSLPTAPSTATAGTPTSSSVPVSWTGGGPLYRVSYKTGTFPSSPGDGSSVDVSGSNTTVSGLNASTAYYFSVYSRDTGVDSGANFFSATAAQVTATTGMALEPNPWVDATNGNDSSNAGTFDAPFKTIKKALTAVGVNGTIHVRPGTYNTTLGETFPIVVPSGAKLQSTVGAASTIIDATGANKRVIELNGTSSSTLVEGFTITGGFFRGATDGSISYGGGIRAYNSDQSSIKRCIITGNTVAGYNGISATYLSGGNAYGGGIDIDGTTKVINCVISNNTAAGGNGYSPLGSGIQGAGYSGGTGDGGGAHSFTAATFFNNTFYGNSATGGNGGTAFSTGGSYAGGSGGNGTYGGLDASTSVSTNCIFANGAQTAGSGGNGAGGGSNGAPGNTTGGVAQSASSTYNLFFNNAGGDGTTGTNAITGQDPLFVNAPSDLHIRSSSPAKYAGTSTGAPSVDLDNTPRPSQPSIGAYELGLFPTVYGGIGRITVTWSGVDGASSYNLYYSTTSPVTTSSTKVTGATSPYVLFPLPNSTGYYFAITAIENSVEGPLSPQAFGMTSGGSGGPWVKAANSGSNFTSVTKDLASGTTLYATSTNTVGLYKSTDAGDTWTALSGPFSGYGMHAVAANGSNVLVAGQGAIYRSSNGGSTWSTSLSGAGIGEDFINSLAIDPLATNIVYGGDFHIDGGSTSSDLIAKSVNSGGTFNNIIDASSTNLRAYYLQIDPSISGTLYAAGSGSPNVAKSTNNGGTWSGISPHNGYPTALALASNLSSTLYAGMRDVDNSTALGVYKSTNSGGSWNPMNGFPSTIPDIQALLVDPANSNHVHAGTSSGYYVTTDGGTNWTSGPSGAGNGINALVQTSNRRLIATSFTGIYLLPLDGPPSISANASPGSGSNAGGDVVTVSGTGFTVSTGLRVLFGGVDGIVNLGASNATSISVTTPPHAVGPVDVAVINPDGQAAIRTSAFTFCTSPEISPTSANYSSAAATGSVQVTTGCDWTATAPGGSFVTITGGSSGSGNGTVNYSVASNGTASSRTTTLTIASKSFVVTQSANGIATISLNALASNGSVAVSWSSSGATSYQVYRSNNGGAFGLVNTTSGLSFPDSTVANGTGYLYQIYGNNGSYSNVDLAVPMAYTHPSIAAGSIIYAADFTELRDALNAARAALGWSAMTFTDPSLSDVAVKRVHLIEIRTGVDGVRAAVALPPLTYTDPSITAGSTLVRAAHVLDLRAGLQ